MKKNLLLTLAAVFTAGLTAQAQTIAQWTFETSFPIITNSTAGTTITNIPAEVGAGTASGTHASASTVYSSPSGNGSVRSFSANNWAVGDYFQFRTSTLGFSGIGVSYDQTGSNTGPGAFGLQYSTDGSTFTPIGSTYAVVNGVWNTTTATNITSYFYDLSPIPALNNAGSVFFRVVDSSTTAIGGGTVAAGGTGRIDNFTVAVIPEPATFALLGIGGFILFVSRRALRNSYT